MPRAPRPPRPALTPNDLFGAELRFWREARSLTAAQLAAACHRDRRTISAAEEGRSIPSETLVGVLDELLGAGGLLLSRYDAIVAERRRLRLNRGSASHEASPDADDRDASEFVDETIPDGSPMQPGERFEKTWTIRNAGSITWSGRRLWRMGIASGVGLITTAESVAIPTTVPGEEVALTVACIAQHVEGTSLAMFKMTDADGRLYFPTRYFPGLQVQVSVLRWVP